MEFLIKTSCQPVFSQILSISVHMHRQTMTEARLRMTVKNPSNSRTQAEPLDVFFNAVSMDKNSLLMSTFKPRPRAEEWQAFRDWNPASIKVTPMNKIMFGHTSSKAPVKSRISQNPFQIRVSTQMETKTKVLDATKKMVCRPVNHLPDGSGLMTACRWIWQTMRMIILRQPMTKQVTDWMMPQPAITKIA